MLYIYLKIFHILSASCVLASIVYSFHLWRSIHAYNLAAISDRIQKQTSLIIIPFAVLQLATGFTMISLQRYNWHQFWMGGSVISFITAIASWFGFIYFLLLSQQAAVSLHKHTQQPRYRRHQSLMLLICGLGLLSMIFFMANKIG
ncbi:MAG TPA: DUF2269 family protein [Gammaproteobacteria bacterium]|nr:DUF2269 family protein [Gammaproteobacteria bacterium]